MPTRSSRPQPDYRRRRMVLGGGVITLALLVGALGTWAWGRYGNVDRVDVDLAAVSKEGPSNYLVVGSDTRDGIGADEAGAGAFLDTGEDQTGHRSDTLMVVRIDPSKRAASVLSVPRDLWVQIDGEGHRINAAYNDGPQAVIDAVQANLGVPINHYVEVDFIAFQRLVEAVGGVPIYVSSPVRDRNSGLNIEQAGCITLDPYQALAFSRARHLEYQKPDGSWATDPTGDLGRVTRQQIFMRRALGQASQLNLTDLGALDTLGTTLTETVTLDQDLSLRTLIALGKRFQDFSPDDLATTVVPTTDRTMPSGAQVQMLDEAAAPGVLAPFRGEAPQGAPAAAGPQPEQVSFELLNGTGRDGLATMLATEFERFGFVSTGVGNPPGGTTDTSEIRYGPQSRELAELAERYFVTPVELVEDDSIGAGELQLVIGTDFNRFDRPDDAPGDTGPTEISAPDDGAGEDSDSDDGGAADSTEAPAVESAPAPDPVGVAIGDPPPGVACP
ncbi:MAG: LCP family protein [Candidatus Microthrix sp.]|nr:LCP family protein [Candidatus Microthrix sp.]